MSAIGVTAMAAACLIVLGSERGQHNGSPMVTVPGGSFQMGVDDDEIPALARRLGVNDRRLFADETPKHPVRIAPFAIDRYEVTNADFARFVAAHPKWNNGEVDPPFRPSTYLQHWTGRAPPPDDLRLPVTYVTWYAATAYCASVGGRLPTEAEWELAARGGLAGPTFPWGDEPPDPSRANFGRSGIGRPVRVGTYPPNGYGLFDMAGNVWEFVADEWQAYPPTPQTNPLAGGALEGDAYRLVTTRRVVRGGSWGAAPVNMWTGYRDSHPPGNATGFVGFRCAASLRR